MTASIPTLLSSVKKLRILLTRKQKLESLVIVLFAFAVSILEVLTALSVVFLLSLMAEPRILGPYLAKVGLDLPSEPEGLILTASILCGTIYLIKNGVSAAQIYFQNIAIQRMNYRFKALMLQKFSQVNYSFYITRSSARSLAVVENDVEQLFSLGVVSLAYALTEVMAVLFLLGFCIAVNPALALIVLVTSSALIWLILKIMLPYLYQHALEARDLVIESNKNLLQFLQAFKDVVVLGKSSQFINRYKFFVKRSAKIKVIQLTLQYIPRLIIETLFMAVLVAMLWFMIDSEYTMQEMIVLLGAYIYVGFRLMPGLHRFINHVQAFKSAAPHIERVYDDFLLLAPAESYVDLPEITFDKNITIRNASFKHHGSEIDVLKNINLVINKGECIGIIGKTGAGKSTLVDLLLGLLKPHTGSVLIDDSYTVNAKQWHQKIGYVSQAVYLVDDDIRANIAFGCDEDEIDDARIHQAIEEAQLSEFIERLPSGMYTSVGERGVRISGGERQRIAIARALYRKPEVLIFDEATSALDNATEKRLMQTIHSLRKNRTVIMIAHRLTTLKGCSRIIQMKDGMIDRELTYEQIEHG